MSKRKSAKYKLDRRMGENIWGRPSSPVNRRSYGPGQHGQRRKGKMSDFGLQLRAKQKLICRTDTATGSLTRKVRTCKTADEWRESNQKTREAVDNFTHDAAAPQQASNPLGG
jgi:ribosomal protein S4